MYNSPLRTFEEETTSSLATLRNIVKMLTSTYAQNYCQENTLFNYTLQLIATDNPYPTYKWMRDHDPAHFSTAENIWVLTRYRDVSNAFKDCRLWSSFRHGNLINDIPERVGKPLGTSDPPGHTFARSLVNKAFTLRTVAQVMQRIRSLAQRLSAQAREKGTLEFVADISAPFKAAILGTMFGVPDSDFTELRHWLDDFFLREPAAEGETPKQVVAMGKLREYLNTLFKARLANPTDDLMTARLLTEENGQRLSQDQVVVTTMTFLTASFESTNNLFTNLTNGLAHHPSLFAELKHYPAFVPAFVEEGIRWDAAQGFVRSPNHDIELYDKVIPQTAQVLLHIGSANRDEREFENADTFDFHRDTKQHLGLGQSIHFCVGAPLGREMTHTIFEEMLLVSDRWETEFSGASRVRTPNFPGFARLPLTIRSTS